MVWISICANTSSVFLPIPGISLIFSGDRNCSICSGFTVVNPSGFLKSDAIFESNLFGLIPIEHVSFSSFLISFFNCCARCCALLKLISVFFVTSRYASSLPTYSNTSAYFSIISIPFDDMSE